MTINIDFTFIVRTCSDLCKEIADQTEFSFIHAEQALADELISKAKMTLNPDKDIPDLPKLKGRSNFFPELYLAF